MAINAAIKSREATVFTVAEEEFIMVTVDRSIRVHETENSFLQKLWIKDKKLP
jgi:hypothetical protein